MVWQQESFTEVLTILVEPVLASFGRQNYYDFSNVTKLQSNFVYGINHVKYLLIIKKRLLQNSKLQT